MSPNMDPTAGYVRGYTDAVTINLDMFQGQSLPNAPGIPYYFNTPTGNQWDRPVSSLRWLASNVLNPAKGAIGIGAGMGILLTVRDMDNRAILEDMPLFRLSEFVAIKGVATRNLYWVPRRINWRNSFVYTTKPVTGVVYLSAVYPPE